MQKKIFTILFATMLTMVAFSSCSDNNDEPKAEIGRAHV